MRVYSDDSLNNKREAEEITRSLANLVHVISGALNLIIIIISFYG
jgi:hypothetical protein